MVVDSTPENENYESNSRDESGPGAFRSQNSFFAD